MGNRAWWVPPVEGGSTPLMFIYLYVCGLRLYVVKSSFFKLYKHFYFIFIYYRGGRSTIFYNFPQFYTLFKLLIFSDL